MDDGFVQVHAELLDLHEAKASTYGTEDDPLSNYVQTSQAFGEADEFTCLVRLQEKLHRAINLYRAGRADEIDEWMDMGALAIHGEALKRRRS